jgi:hypothetical protein
MEVIILTESACAGTKLQKSKSGTVLFVYYRNDDFDAAIAEGRQRHGVDVTATVVALPENTTLQNREISGGDQ